MPLIIIIHPEGNINNNPNLTGIVELLVQEGWSVNIYSPRRSHFKQHSPCDGAKLVLVDQKEENGCFLFQALDDLTRRLYIRSSFSGATLLIGVDRGIIEASIIANELNIPFGLISYEITFEEETSKKFKSAEILACRNISFAIVPDKLRGKELARENIIPEDLLFYVPVAGRGFSGSVGFRPRLFNQRFGIPIESHIALYMGTVSKWAMCDALLTSVNKWPENWHLVIHNRHGLDQETNEIIMAAPNSRSRIHISTDPFDLVCQMRDFICSADLGIAFYKPSYQHMWLGKNLEYIGMASGKTATYLQHGIPVAVNLAGEMNDLIHNRKIGQVVENPYEFIPDDSVLDAGSRCLEFFHEHLDLSHTLIPWLEYVSAITQKNAVHHAKQIDSGEAVMTSALTKTEQQFYRCPLDKNMLMKLVCLYNSQGRYDDAFNAFKLYQSSTLVTNNTNSCAPEYIENEIANIEWFHQIDLGNGVKTPGRDDSEHKLQLLGIPENLINKTVLDIGAWDGFFSFTAEKRGAVKVVAVDIPIHAGLKVAKKILDSQIIPMEIDVMDIAPENSGMFDVVLCLGVLYHLKHPLMALERIYSVTAGQLILETYVDMLDCDRPAMAFYPGTELNGDPSNWCGPNPEMVLAMLKTVGFRKAEMYSNTFSGGYAANRAVFHAWR